MPRIVLLFAMTLMTAAAQEFTRGLGVYPGDPKQYTGPSLRIDEKTYRNLALRRPAYHSSSYDYNLTAQLVTDGIRETKTPAWIAVTTSGQGVLKKNEREWLLDNNWVTTVDLRGKTGWIQIEFGGAEPPEVDRLDIDGSVQARQADNQQWSAMVSVSNDGKTFREAGRSEGMARPTGEVRTQVLLSSSSRARFYRIDFNNGRPLTWRIGEIAFFRRNAKLNVAGPHPFASAWMPAGRGEEWVYVDLGAECTFDRIALDWIRRAAEGSLQVSADATTWRDLRPLAANGGLVEEFKFAPAERGRYVRLLLKRPAVPEGCILSEIEVFGRGGPVAVAKPQAPARADGRLDLAGGAWRVQRDSLVKADGRVLSTAGYNDADWLVATVPGTTLVSYLNAGALPDPNFGDNQLMISDSFFHADFWYRNEFAAPDARGRQLFLNFGGVNWKADVFLNGEKLGRIEGGFQRARFNITKLVRNGQKNALAVRVEKNATPGSIKEKTFESPDKNGGALGADNPTYHATIGWDWIPTIRGRDTGIWNEVYVTASGPVTIDNAFASSKLPLPDTSRAEVTIEATLRNHTAARVEGTLRGRFGDAAFEMPAAIDASSAKTVKLEPGTHRALLLANPKLWWPNGYGEPNLYPVELRFETGGTVSGAASFQTGVRQFTYSEDGGVFRMWVNGRRFIARGGNWGFGESMLRYRAREYDAAVRYHRDLNFNMVRNWVGQIGDEAFYEACDRHGIVVWQDFWLANPWDGPDPDDNAMFLNNTADMILRIRSHPSIGLYCGRNEGYPPKYLDDGIRQALAVSHPGIHYISSSADDVVTGHGPYRAMPLKFYFQERAATKFHSEMGMPNIVSMESLRAMMPEDSMWPQGRMWGLHDFCLTGAQGGASFRGQIDKAYGGARNIEEWVALAQLVNYEGHRAMFEAQSRNRMGLLMWMSHPTWPSLVWETYDYYLEPGSAYFGCRKASEPLHIQWNPAADTVEVVNYSAGRQSGLTARVRVLNLDGSMKWEKSAAVDSAEDTTLSPFKIEYPGGLTPVHFLRLELLRGTDVVSENFYWRGTEEGNYQGLRTLPKVRLGNVTTVERQGGEWRISTELRNPGTVPALMVRLKAVRQQTGDRILPVLYSDNYIALMPGETKKILTTVRHADTRGERPAIVVEGFNVEAAR